MLVQRLLQKYSQVFKKNRTIGCDLFREWHLNNDYDPKLSHLFPILLFFYNAYICCSASLELVVFDHPLSRCGSVFQSFRQHIFFGSSTSN